MHRFAIWLACVLLVPATAGAESIDDLRRVDPDLVFADGFEDGQS
jgi:hypothetical protein